MDTIQKFPNYGTHKGPQERGGDGEEGRLDQQRLGRVYTCVSGCKGKRGPRSEPGRDAGSSHTRVLHMLRLLGRAFEGGAFGGGIRDSNVCDEGSGYHLVRSVDQMRVTQFTSIISAHI